MRFLKMKTLIVLVLLISTVSVFAQTKKEAVDAYNKGAAAIASDPAGAVAAFEECIAISKQLGEEGEETYNNAAKQIPGLHYKIAMIAYKKKDFPVAIKEFEKAMDTGDTYNNEQIAGKANKVIPQVYNISATNHYKNKRYEEALVCFDKAIEYKPDYAKPYLGKAGVYKKQGDSGKMIEMCDKAIELGKKTNDKKTAGSAMKLAKNSMFNQAVSFIGKEQWPEAESSLNKSIAYGNKTPDAYYQLGKVLSSQKKWDEAIASLNKAIELDAESDNVAKAKYYFELGDAYLGSGDSSAACAAYKNAVYGDYAANAKYQVEQVLKCK